MKLGDLCREVLLQLQPLRPSERVELEVLVNPNGEVVAAGAAGLVKVTLCVRDWSRVHESLPPSGAQRAELSK